MKPSKNYKCHFPLFRGIEQSNVSLNREMRQISRLFKATLEKLLQLPDRVLEFQELNQNSPKFWDFAALTLELPTTKAEKFYRIIDEQNTKASIYILIPLSFYLFLYIYIFYEISKNILFQLTQIPLQISNKNDHKSNHKFDHVVLWQFCRIQSRSLVISKVIHLQNSNPRREVSTLRDVKATRADFQFTARLDGACMLDSTSKETQTALNGAQPRRISLGKLFVTESGPRREQPPGEVAEDAFESGLLQTSLNFRHRVHCCGFLRRAIRARRPSAWRKPSKPSVPLFGAVIGK